MSADKHKGLATRAAYLRLAAREGGLGLNVKWARKLTPFLKSMADEGEVTLRSVRSGWRKTVTTAFITSKGTLRLAAIEARFGPHFGTNADISRVEPLVWDKPTRDRIQAGITPAQERRQRRERAACARERMGVAERALRRLLAKSDPQDAATA